MRMNLMRPVFAALVAASLLSFVGCCGSACGDAASSCCQQKQSRAEQLRAKFDSADRDYVFVVAHRSDWRHNPENFIPSILRAIEMGVDMVEIDVAKTKDGHFVLSHDGSLDCGSAPVPEEDQPPFALISCDAMGNIAPCRG